MACVHSLGGDDDVEEGASWRVPSTTPGGREEVAIDDEAGAAGDAAREAAAVDEPNEEESIPPQALRGHPDTAYFCSL